MNSSYLFPAIWLTGQSYLTWSPAEIFWQDSQQRRPLNHRHLPQASVSNRRHPEFPHLQPPSWRPEVRGCEKKNQFIFPNSFMNFHFPFSVKCQFIRNCEKAKKVRFPNTAHQGWLQCSRNISSFISEAPELKQAASQHLPQPHHSDAKGESLEHSLICSTKHLSHTMSSPHPLSRDLNLFASCDLCSHLLELKS